MQKKLPDRANGFTLIETALALLVIGLAFLSLLGLGKSGLQSVKEANNETRCEVMADAVFETLNLYNQRFTDHARTNNVGQSWFYLWSQAANTQNFFPFPPVAGMSMSPNLYLKINEGYQTAYDLDNLSLTDWNPNYRLAVTTNSISTISNQPNTLNVKLYIQPDGDTQSSEQRIFSTIITKEGML